MMVCLRTFQDQRKMILHETLTISESEQSVCRKWFPITKFLEKLTRLGDIYKTGLDASLHFRGRKVCEFKN